MVQVLQRQPKVKGPSVVEQLIGGGLHGAIDYGTQLQGEKKQQAQKQQYGQQAQKLTGIDFGPLDEKQFGEIVKQHVKNVGKEQQSARTQENIDKLVGNYTNKRQSQGQQLSSDGTESYPTEQSEGFRPSQIPPEDLLELSADNAAVGTAARHLYDIDVREQREEKKAKEAQLENLRKETLPIRQEISQKAELSRAGIQNKEDLLRLIDKGDINDPTYAALASALPLDLGKRLLSDDTVTYKAGLIDEYADLRKIFTGQTRVKELDILEQKLADLYLTDSQKKAILNSRIKALKADLIREEAAEQLEGKPLGLIQYRRELEKLAAPKLKALFDGILDEQQSITQAAENRKKLPLDISDPEDKSIMMQILKEAKGNKVLAKKIAKDKGYTIKGSP